MTTKFALILLTVVLTVKSGGVVGSGGSGEAYLEATENRDNPGKTIPLSVTHDVRLY